MSFTSQSPNGTLTISPKLRTLNQGLAFAGKDVYTDLGPRMCIHLQVKNEEGSLPFTYDDAIAFPLRTKYLYTEVIKFLLWIKGNSCSPLRSQRLISFKSGERDEYENGGSVELGLRVFSSRRLLYFTTFLGVIYLYASK